MKPVFLTQFLLDVLSNDILLEANEWGGHLAERVPVILGSKNEVERVARYHT